MCFNFPLTKQKKIKVLLVFPFIKICKRQFTIKKNIAVKKSSTMFILQFQETSNKSEMTCENDKTM